MTSTRRTVVQRLENRVATVQLRVRGRNPALVALRVAQRSSEVRVAGLAAEMCYYLVLSILPLVTAVGAGLGLLSRFVEPATVMQMRVMLTSAVQAVLSPELAADVATPLVRELLRSEQVGAALGSVAGALLLGSLVFRAAVRALGEAYRTSERRSLVRLWGLSLVFTVAAVLVLGVLLSVLVVGPLLGGGRRLADLVGAGQAFEPAWTFGRWPVVLLVCAVFLAWLYHVGQNADKAWRDAVPGALLATVGLVVLMAGFRLYVDVAGPRGPDLGDGPDAVRVVGRFIGTALAAMLLGWLASMVVLVGGVFNAEWHAGHDQGGNSPPDSAGATAAPG